MKHKSEYPSNEPSVICLSDKYALFQEQWNPKIVASCNNQLVKIAKVCGEFVWHKHEGQDELFLVVKGKLTIDLPKGQSITLNEGDITVIPKGMEHRPRTDGEETWILMIEPPETRNTGQHMNEFSITNPDWI